MLWRRRGALARGCLKIIYLEVCGHCEQPHQPCQRGVGQTFGMHERWPVSFSIWEYLCSVGLSELEL